MGAMQWSETTESRGVSEQGFRLEVEGREVPGILWRAEGAAENAPLVLIGHGGTQHKRSGYVLSLARMLARHHGIASFAIDGPGHGERSIGEDFETTWARDGINEEMVADWRGALDGVISELAPSSIGYWGLSMGTMMGVPVVAAEPRIEVALLGLMGFGRLNGDRLRADAPRVSCPVRFLLQWDDELIDRQGGLDLFAALSSEVKSLHANPGLHSAVPPQEFRDTVGFLASYLSG